MKSKCCLTNVLIAIFLSHWLALVEASETADDVGLLGFVGSKLSKGWSLFKSAISENDEIQVIYEPEDASAQPKPMPFKSVLKYLKSMMASGVVERQKAAYEALESLKSALTQVKDKTTQVYVEGKFLLADIGIINSRERRKNQQGILDLLATFLHWIKSFFTGAWHSLFGDSAASENKHNKPDHYQSDGSEPTDESGILATHEHPLNANGLTALETKVGDIQHVTPPPSKKFDEQLSQSFVKEFQAGFAQTPGIHK